MRNLSAVSGIAELATTPEQHCFGGAVETAHWISRVVSGAFVIEPDELSSRLKMG